MQAKIHLNNGEAITIKDFYRIATFSASGKELHESADVGNFTISEGKDYSFSGKDHTVCLTAYKLVYVEFLED